MDNYIAFIRKADFVDLFKYGSLHVNKDVIRQFSCEVTDLPNRLCIFNDLICFSNAFDSTFEYLFIHYTKVGGRVNDVSISDVQGVYPLDNEAKIELSGTLDPRVEVKDPLWPGAVLELQKRHTFEGGKAGINNIWKIYNLPDSIDSISQYIEKSVLNEIVEEIYNNKHPMGNLPIWTYVMRYERHAFYPNNTVGYFMDTFNAIFNYMQKREVDSSEIENTKIMQFLSFCNQQPREKLTFDNIITALHQEPAVENIIAKAKEIEPNFDLIKAATLFYIFRARYQEDFKYEENYHHSGLKSGFEFSVACYMLGFILGHEHTYDCLYSAIQLPMFKKVSKCSENVKPNPSSTPAQIVTQREPSEPPFRGKDSEGNNPIVEGEASQEFPPKVDEMGEVIPSKINAANNDKAPKVEGASSNQPSELPFELEGSPLDEPIPMKKGARGRKIVYARTQEEYISLLDAGYMQATAQSKKIQRKK